MLVTLDVFWLCGHGCLNFFFFFTCLHRIFIVERWICRKHLVDENTKCPPVYTLSVALTRHYFRSQVVRCTTQCPRSISYCLFLIKCFWTFSLSLYVSVCLPFCALSRRVVFFVVALFSSLSVLCLSLSLSVCVCVFNFKRHLWRSLFVLSFVMIFWFWFPGKKMTNLCPPK